MKHFYIHTPRPLFPSHDRLGEIQKMTCSTRSERPEPPVQSAKLSHFNPPGLEIDDGNDKRIDAENSFMVKPIEKEPAIREVDRPLRDGEKYYLPTDKAELSRLDHQHVVWTKALDGDLFKAPISEPKHVFDVGTGTGIWAVDFAKAFPDAQVLGIDLSEPRPPEVPPNCKFEERDFTGHWGYPQKFDLIHCRMIFSAPHNPQTLMQQAYSSLAPGGYLEYHEMYAMPMDVDGTLSGTILEQLFVDGIAGAARLGNHNMIALPRYKRWMVDAGFEDVVEIHRALPFNGWAKGSYKAVGEVMQGNIEAGLGSVYTGLLTRGLGWSPEKADEVIRKAREQVRDSRIHAYFPIFVVYGRKPLNAT
ncbi:S-adenosyl-L-methionine-dependent methyltransferase [Hypoxylon crocopeplum]|nr:S-adenosyl-L-methionine-dependent methyltransferase [Hypoxylon crocopeplum]